MIALLGRLRQGFQRSRRRPAPLRCLPTVEGLEDRCLLASGYLQTNLVSDLPNIAATTDANLVNPWGIAISATSPFWVADNSTGVSTLYNGVGTPFPQGKPLVVTVQASANTGATSPAPPTGIVFTGTSDFTVSAAGKSGPALFIFVTEDGTIAGWNPQVNPTTAVLAVDNTNFTSTGPVYKGAALASNASGIFLFVTNFRNGTIDVFDKNFAKVVSPGGFLDPGIPAGFAPFNIKNIDGQLFVTYAMQDPAKMLHDDLPGAGNGFIDVFDTSGNFLRRFASHGTLNSPWGMAVAPADFGDFSGDLLVGNFGDGRINAFDPKNGTFLGQLSSPSGQPITIGTPTSNVGLWGLTFGNGGSAGNAHTLFFAAGINEEANGLFGSLQPAAAAPDQHFVAQVYRDLLHREADPDGLAFWTSMLSQNVSRTQVALGIENTPEYRTVEVQAAYRLLLHRAADPDGLNTFVKFLAAGGTVEQLEAMLAASPEYFQNRAGGTNDGFITAFFQDALNRTADPGARMAFDQALMNGTSRTQVAAMIFGSQEFQQDLVKGFAQQFLHRAADPQGLSASVAALQAGLRDETLIAVILGSQEYFARV
jgi:uncharacterized protein (TIGR03118 family)